MRNLKMAAAAVLAVMWVAPASANIVAPLGVLLAPSTTNFGDPVVAGSFTDDFTFSVVQPVAIRSSTTVTNSEAVISPWSLAIWNLAHTVQFGFTNTTQVAGTTLALLNLVLTSPGDYLIEVTGTVNGPGNSTAYNGNITLSPVPLPGALPLFATGLGGLFLLRRKRKKAAATVAV